jgi:hypothetical protein
MANGLVEQANGLTGLSGGNFVLRYDTNYFTVSPGDVHLGALENSLSGWSVSADTGSAGVLIIYLSHSGSGLITSTAGGSLVTVDFHVKTTAPMGVSTSFNLSADSTGGVVVTGIKDQNNGSYALNPAPQNGADITDGSVTIVTAHHVPQAVNDAYSITRCAGQRR